MFKPVKPLIIFEMANNHQGDVGHGKRIIREYSRFAGEYDFDFAFKFQYRNLEAIIHPLYRNRTDLKFIRRFMETALTEEEFLELKEECAIFGFKTMCTPFDEDSVKLIVKHGYDYLKIASCSVKDWPLLDAVAGSSRMPVIVSTGGAEITDVENIVSFFQHRDRELALMHCVGIYPTADCDFTLNRIDWFHERFPGITVGFSTHEEPADFLPVVAAVAKGAVLFEKHVGVETADIKLNLYSATPRQTGQWLAHLEQALALCGVRTLAEYRVSEKEKQGLKDLKRGVFARRLIRRDEKFSLQDVFLAMPAQDNQMTADDFSLLNKSMSVNRTFRENEAITDFNIDAEDMNIKAASVIHKVKSILSQARIIVGEHEDVELSHHYGIEKFSKTGVTMINVINREYCKKLLIQVPGQWHPEHYHRQKEETFHILWGSLFIDIDGVTREYKPGEMVTVMREQKHSFWSVTGVVIEEISTRHDVNDSCYTESAINENRHRKSKLTDWIKYL